MLAISSQISSAANPSAISDTVRRVNVEALDLLIRRDAINRRIRSLHQLMHGLRNLTAKVTRPEPIVQPTTHLPDHAAFPSDRLRRACRIALLEIEGAASVDEIHARAFRRGSFSFGDSRHPQADILQALILMEEKGEIVRTDNGSEIAWQRNSAEASDISLPTLSLDRSPLRRSRVLISREEP